jgi:hypothetical protein
LRQILPTAVSSSAPQNEGNLRPESLMPLNWNFPERSKKPGPGQSRLDIADLAANIRHRDTICSVSTARAELD